MDADGARATLPLVTARSGCAWAHAVTAITTRQRASAAGENAGVPERVPERFATDLQLDKLDPPVAGLAILGRVVGDRFGLAEALGLEPCAVDAASRERGDPRGGARLRQLQVVAGIAGVVGV